MNLIVFFFFLTCHTFASRTSCASDVKYIVKVSNRCVNSCSCPDAPGFRKHLLLTSRTARIPLAQCNSSVESSFFFC
ncbi:hypothetical protein EDC96DRAFT_516373 [Choanephora cucurbitarum]|nr:hypothetical protein EDC96DRAFT_516373 [Choanephora cucurbitarum]